MPLKYQMWLTGAASSMWPMRSRRTFALGDLDAAAVADFALVADLLILSAVAFPVLCGPENALAEKAVALGFERAVAPMVSGFLTSPWDQERIISGEAMPI